MTATERLKAIRERAERKESAKAYIAHMRREANAIVIGQAISQSVHFYAPSMVSFCDAIDAELQELDRARKCLEAVWVVGNPEINTIINRELGGEA